MHKSLVAWSGRACRRDSIPVRCVIQSASKPNRAANSLFDTTVSGTYEPHEMICTPRRLRVRRLKRRPPAVAGVRCGMSRGLGNVMFDEGGAADTATPWEMFSKDMNPIPRGVAWRPIERVIESPP
jgi:hypothetical protein